MADRTSIDALKNMLAEVELLLTVRRRSQKTGLAAALSGYALRRHWPTISQGRVAASPSHSPARGVPFLDYLSTDEIVA
jgi:hypothetical protein